MKTPKRPSAHFRRIFAHTQSTNTIIGTLNIVANYATHSICDSCCGGLPITLNSRVRACVCAPIAQRCGWTPFCRGIGVFVIRGRGRLCAERTQISLHEIPRRCRRADSNREPPASVAVVAKHAMPMCTCSFRCKHQTVTRTVHTIT